MRVEIEDFVRFDESLIWRIGGAYYANRGIAAWTAGDLPWEGTNNAAFARQHAEFFAGIAKDVAPSRGPIHVLEIGSGLGRFAPAFLAALRESGARGRKLAERVRFVMSDVAPRSVREAADSPALRDLVAAGQVVPALLDVVHPTLRTLDGEPLDVPLTMVVANYVCDVTPVSIFRKDGEHFEEKHARVIVEVPDGDSVSREALVQGLLDRSADPAMLKSAEFEVRWAPVDLDARLPADHAAALRTLVAGLDQATVPWFGVFLDLVAALRPRMRPGGVLVVNDYGDSAAAELHGIGDVLGRRYGNSTSHPVNLAMLDAFGARLGTPVLRTLEPFRSLHTAAVIYGPHSATHDAAFREAFVDQHPCEDLLDFTAAARAAKDAGQHMLSVRLYRRALEVDPRSPEWHFWIGEECLSASRPVAALEFLNAGRALDTHQQWDFAFHLGRACHRLNRHSEAEAWYRESLAREDHPATRFDLALVYRDLQDFDRARVECREALRLTPDYERAAKLLADIEAEPPPNG